MSPGNATAPVCETEAVSNHMEGIHPKGSRYVPALVRPKTAASVADVLSRLGGTATEAELYAAVDAEWPDLGMPAAAFVAGAVNLGALATLGDPFDTGAGDLVFALDTTARLARRIGHRMADRANEHPIGQTTREPGDAWSIRRQIGELRVGGDFWLGDDWHTPKEACFRRVGQTVPERLDGCPCVSAALCASGCPGHDFWAEIPTACACFTTAHYIQGQGRIMSSPDAAPRPSRLTNAAQRRSRPEPQWAVAGVMPEYGVGQIYGPSYTGKTFVCLDLALRIANRSEGSWFGREVRRHGPVVYVLMEGAWDFGKRVEAWLGTHPGTSDADLYTLEEEAVDLRSELSVDTLAGDVEGLGLAPALLVVDTQSLATPGTDENSNTDMNAVFGNLKRLSKRLGCFILLVHHTGHDTSRARGASAQFAALDVVIQVTAGQVQATKVKAYKPWDSPEGFILRASGASVAVERVGWWEAAANTAAAAANDAERRVLEALAHGPLTARELRTAAGGNTAQHTTAREALEQRGLVTRGADGWALCAVPEAVPEHLDGTA